MKANKLAMGAVVGAVVGVVAGILTAPKSGVETREQIKDKAEELKNKADEKKHEITTKTVDSTDEVLMRLEDAFEAVRAKFGKK